ncbi:MAG TPA: hypothetical protein VIB39_03025 [Candidatus Angelobacter sp.]
MAAKPGPHSDKTRPRLLAAGWILLGLSLFLGIAGPRLSASNLPPDIRGDVGDLDWLSLGWIIMAMIVGALALMCFVAHWVLRRETDTTLPERMKPR